MSSKKLCDVTVDVVSRVLLDSPTDELVLPGNCDHLLLAYFLSDLLQFRNF